MSHFHELLLFWFPQYIKVCYHSIFYINFHNISKYFCSAYKFKKICLENTSLILLVDTFPPPPWLSNLPNSRTLQPGPCQFFFFSFLLQYLPWRVKWFSITSSKLAGDKFTYILCRLIVNSMFISIWPHFSRLLIMPPTLKYGL